ncbi:unnamed protein product [Linum trigynum]|uniref:FMR1-interacting protein 1 conserved domain-containing protein n=1 Tax=Linum trigynum TaxID=586398 RepID=A0AAV2ELN0_9ROSI
MRHPGPGNSFRPRPQHQPQPPAQLQANANANPTAPGNSQGLLGNPSQGNSPFMMQSSVPMQPPVGGINPPTFNNSCTHQSNGQFMPNMHPMMMQQPGYFNAPPMMAPPQLNPGFPPQNYPSNMGGAPMYANQMNPFQQVQLVQQLATLVQHLSQNVGLMNMPPHQMQNMNSMMPLQVPNLPQVGPGNIPPNCHPPPVPQNPNMFPNRIFGAVQQPNPNQQNFVMQPMGANMPNSSTATTEQGPGPGNPSAAEQAFQSQSSSFPRQQGNFDGNAQGSKTNPQWRNSPRKDFKQHFNKEGSQPRYNNSQNLANDNKKRKFELKGHGYERAPKFAGTNSPSQVGTKKRTLVVNYPEHEVKQWCELRKKNYPTKSNIDKKQALKLANSEAIEKEATLRREQLKEVLAKQAELGVEVAEVPSHYLSDSNKQATGQGDGRWEKKKGRFQNKHDKRRERRNKRGQKNGNHATTSTHDDHSSPSGVPAANKKQPTLLEKLLSRDIKKDNQRLLQAFRFMAMNSFFKDSPGKPLSFPEVAVQEDDIGTTVVVEENAACDGKSEEVSDERGVESLTVEINAGQDHGHDHYNGKQEQQLEMKPTTGLTRERRNLAVEIVKTEGEEGEIID